jgi:SAM-dependent methyltransferase
MEEQLHAKLYAIEDAHWWFRGRRAVIETLLRSVRLPQSPRILDVGCGSGRNLQEYARFGRAEGVDPSKAAVDFCRARGLTNVHQAGLDALPYEDASFDLVCASDVLEHVDDDEGALRELRRVAVDGAWLLVTVPAYRWLWSHHDDTHGHRRRYTRRVIVARAEAAGWRCRRATYFNSTLLLPIAAARAAQRLALDREKTDYDRTPAWLSTPLELIMRGEARLIEAGLSLPAGVSVGLVCRAG